MQHILFIFCFSCLLFSNEIYSLCHQRHIFLGCYATDKFYSFVPHYFTLKHLAPAQGSGIIVGLLDAQATTHGKVCASLVKNIAPKALIYFANCFNSKGYASLDSIHAGLNKLMGSDIVLLNFKIDQILYDDPCVSRLNECLARYNWVVACSGNDAQTFWMHPYNQVRLADSPFVSLIVGSWTLLNKIPTLSPFCQACAIAAPAQDNNDRYQGTSLSASLVSGLMALLLAEFRNILTKNQLLLCVLASTFSLSDISDRCSLGLLDFRMCLYMSHIMAYCKINTLLAKNTMNRDSLFLEALLKLRTFLIKPVQDYIKASVFNYALVQKLQASCLTNVYEYGLNLAIIKDANVYSACYSTLYYDNNLMYTIQHSQKAHQGYNP